MVSDLLLCATSVYMMCKDILHRRLLKNSWRKYGNLRTCMLQFWLSSTACYASTPEGCHACSRLNLCNRQRPRFRCDCFIRLLRRMFSARAVRCRAGRACRQQAWPAGHGCCGKGARVAARALAHAPGWHACPSDLPCWQNNSRAKKYCFFQKIRHPPQSPVCRAPHFFAPIILYNGWR